MLHGYPLVKQLCGGLQVSAAPHYPAAISAFLPLSMLSQEPSRFAAQLAHNVHKTLATPALVSISCTGCHTFHSIAWYWGVNTSAGCTGDPAAMAFKCTYISARHMFLYVTQYKLSQSGMANHEFHASNTIQQHFLIMRYMPELCFLELLTALLCRSS